MCSFIVTNREIKDLEKVNFYSKRRGPDNTRHCLRDGVHFVHNLLHLTGDKDLAHQPFEEGDVVATFNGEIYNYKDFGDYKTDGECIIPLYKEYGLDFAKHLDGEFAIVIVDFEKESIIIASDVFGTKPLYYSFENGEFGVASYKSSLLSLGFKDIYKCSGGVTCSRNFQDPSPFEGVRLGDFDLNQHKDTYDDWITAFERAVEKRTRSEYGIFMGLSAGYDSGAIACALNNLGKRYKSYTVVANENPSIVAKRLSKIVSCELIELTREQYRKTKKEMREICENFQYADKFGSYNIKHDKASVGLAAICRRANKDNKRIYLSGQGADEIISDYGFRGKGIYSHSEFGGLFPSKLEGFFPWHSFYDGTQIKFLNKEEYVAGAYGIEARYIYLDRQLVQEFLYLTPELKNAHYKAPLREYMIRNNYPFEEGKKTGFQANRNLL